MPITCAVLKKLVNDMLICSTAYEALMENVEINGCINQVLIKLNESIKREDHGIRDENENVAVSAQLNVNVTNNESDNNKDDFIKLK